jgi:two-component system, OmpR family, response regulator
MSDPIRVLLIDDEQIFVDSLTKVLRRRQMKVQSAPNGAAGLELLSREEFDVIVLDVRMPGMDGIATFQAIRERDSVTPVIFLSGHIDIKQVAQALKDGCAEVLLKPCPIDNLVSCIEDAYERKCCALDVAEKT